MFRVAESVTQRYPLMGQAFQFSPVNGVIPIVDVDPTAMHGATPAAAVVPYDPEAIPDEPAPRVTAATRAAPASTVAKSAVVSAAPIEITPRMVIKAARARLKEIKAELRRHEALKKERAQLERMLVAAGKPSASLTSITSRRAG